MVTTAQLRNGVDVQLLGETIEAIKENPALARFQFRTQSTWEGGARSTTSIDSFYGVGTEQHHQQTHRLTGDEPAALLGSDSGPNAVETVLSALASCLAVGYAYNAAAQGIEIEELHFQLDGELDLRAFLGLSEEVRPGYESIQVRYQVKSLASREQLVELCDYVQRTSPVLDMLANRVPISVELID
jgi:uncharacterized OsmC-like protein